MTKHGRETHHFLKMGKMLVSLDLCILNHSSSDSWFQDRHRQETVACLQEVIKERIDEYYSKKRSARTGGTDKVVKPKADPPKMLQGNTVKIGYKFTKRPVTQRCLLMKSTFESMTLFPEKLHVYVCEYHPATVLQTTAKLMHTIYKESVPATVGVSDYFQPASKPDTGRVTTTTTTSALKKKNRLKRIVGRQTSAQQVKEPPAATASDSRPSSPTRDPATGHGTTRTGGEVDEKDPDDVGDDIMRWSSSCASDTAERPRAPPRQRVTTSDTRVSTLGTEMVSSGSDVMEPAKKRKRNDGDWSEGKENRRTKPMPTSTGLDFPDGESGKPMKKQRTGEGFHGQSLVQVARVEDAVAKEELVVAKENIMSERETKAVGGDPVADCGIVEEEIYSDGDVDCLNNLPLQPEDIGKLSSLQLQRLVHRSKRYLKQIFTGKRPCKRHADYKQGGSVRANLTYEAWYGPFSEEQLECIMGELVQMYCSRHNKYFDYISKVLMPEALTKICMDVLCVSLDEAQAVLEKMPPCGDSTLLGTRFKGLR